ncbi:MAG: DUF3164 family protein [Alphaproteobacteria bacterium]
MNSATPAIPEGYMEDAKGRLVPVDQIKPADQLMDDTVRKILGYADELNAQIKRFKAHTFDDVHTCIDLLAEQYGAKRGGAKGNITLTSFDGRAKVEVKVQDHIEFGPELQAAKTLIDECIAEWSSDSRSEIRALVNHAFNVDKPGQVNRAALFQLRRIEIDDDRWRQAVQAINDSIRITGTKAYIRFARRSSPRERWKHVAIDLAAV